MAHSPTLETSRLTLREWRDADRAPFALMSADPRVMEYFPAIMSETQSDALFDFIVEGWSRGYGLWAVEERDSRRFIGFVGLMSPAWEAPFTPCVEIGWRLAFSAWGRGYATEAAEQSVQWAKTNVDAPRGELVSFTTVANERSRRVMEKLGFTHDDHDDFDHPMVPEWEFRRHVLYRLKL
jgi:RimJ/RimL family protein N-acetyltransferase